MNAVKGDATIGSLLGELATETSTLVRQELRLASTEIGQKADVTLGGAKLIAAGSGVAHAGLLTIFAAIVIGLRDYVPMWASAAILGLLALVGGVAVIYAGTKALREVDLVPKRTVESLSWNDAHAPAKEPIR